VVSAAHLGLGAVVGEELVPAWGGRPARVGQRARHHAHYSGVLQGLGFKV